jgi:hypothetical protein
MHLVQSEKAGLERCCKYETLYTKFKWQLMGKFRRYTEYKFIGRVNGRKATLPPEVQDELGIRILQPEEYLFGL